MSARHWLAGLVEACSLVAGHVTAGIESLADKIDPDAGREVDVNVTHTPARLELCPACVHVHPIVNIYAYTDEAPDQAVLIGAWPCPVED